MGEETQLWLIRHGETEWSLSGAHTSRTDVPLTEHGRKRAEELRDFLKTTTFQAVYTSPMQRATETCRIAGLGDVAEIDDNLQEWNYGIYEGQTTRQIRVNRPNWSVWTEPITDGETVQQVGQRADQVIARALAAGDKRKGSKIALFAHAHILRILAARWLDLAADGGRLLALGTGSVSVLGWERETRVIVHWNRGFEAGD